MTSINGLQPTPGVAPTPLSCSICFELVTSGNDRSIAKLMCGHQFHLDCIGSAFNAKGMMQCPNCRHTENGQWLYANGHHQREDVMEDMGNEEEYRVFAEVSELLFPHDLMNLGNLWCPVQSSYTQLSLSVGDINHPSAAHADVVFNIYMDDSTGRPESSQACPFLQAQGLNFPRHAPLGEGNMGAAGVPLNPHHGAAAQNLSSGQNFSSPGGQWPRPSTPSAMPNGGDGMAFPGRPRPVHHDHQLAGNSFSSHRRENAVSWVSLPAQSSIRHPPYYPEGQVLSESPHWEFTQSGIRDTTWETGPRDNVPLPQWRREGSSALQHFPPELETRSWASPPLSGLYGSHGPENAIRTGSRNSEGHLASQYQGHFQGYPPSLFSESRMDTGSFQPPSFNSPR